MYFEGAVKEMELRPVLKTLYDRTAFQSGDSDSVRLSLDVNLQMHRLDNHGFAGSQHFLELHGPFVEFPLAVLEIKLHKEYLLNPPAWIQSLLDSCLIVPCEKFSK